MTDAQTILRLIEAVDPEDSEKLDEIDALVFGLEREIDKVAIAIEVPRDSIPSYTRSRDALKAIRPEGFIEIDVTNGARCGLNLRAANYEAFESPKLPTEELAELHAIIQAIEFERESDKQDEAG